MEHHEQEDDTGPHADIASGATVVTANGETVGTVEHLVLDADSLEVTHLVVARGFIFKEDRIVPLATIESADDGNIELVGGVDVESLPAFETKQYVAIDEGSGGMRPERPSPYFVHPPLLSEPLISAPAAVAVTQRNIPDGSVVLETGAEVFAESGERVGTIDGLASDLDGAPSVIMATPGLLPSPRKSIPTPWIESVAGEAGVHLSVDHETVEMRMPLDN